MPLEDCPHGSDCVYCLMAAELTDGPRPSDLAGRLPSKRELAEEYGVSVDTVREAMAVLREQGLI
jgi:hypothetical protein